VQALYFAGYSAGGSGPDTTCHRAYTGMNPIALTYNDVLNDVLIEDGLIFDARIEEEEAKKFLPRDSLRYNL
jgi:hypothetical protein